MIISKCLNGSKFSFNVSRKYEWTKKGDATVLNSDTNVSKLTIAKVLYDNDKENKYK